MPRITDLNEARNYIRENKIRGPKLTSIISRICYQHNKEEVGQWVLKNNYFRDFKATLDGIHQSNKWSLIKNEISKDLIRRKRIYDFAYCFALFKQSVDIKQVRDSNLLLAELLLISSFSVFKEIRFPYNFTVVLYKLRVEKSFGLPTVRFKLPYHLKVSGSKYDYTNIGNEERIKNNENIIYAFNNVFSELFSELIDDASHLEKYLIITSGFINSETFIDNSISNTIAQRWYLIEEDTLSMLLGNSEDSDFFYFEWNNVTNMWDKSDLEVLELSAKNIANAFLGLRILQLRLHRNQVLDINYEQLQSFKPLHKYIFELCRAGILEVDKIAKSFKWPELNNLPEWNIEEYDLSNVNFESDSPLTFLNYHVGKSGQTTPTRHNILSTFYEGNSHIEDTLHRYWGNSWGAPNSQKRLRKIVYHIFNQIINKKALGHYEAVTDWHEDLSYLKCKYYNSQKRMTFKFPEL